MSASPRLVVVDLAQDDETVIKSLHDACSNLGAFYVVNHGVDQALIDAMFAQSAAFYAQPREVRQALAAAPEGTPGAHMSGWHASGSIVVDKAAAAPDTREVLRIALTDVDLGRHPAGKAAPVSQLLTGPPAAGLPLWPDASRLPDFQPTMLAYFDAVNRLAERLIRLAARALGLPADALLADDAAQREAAWTTLMLLHYPAQVASAERGEFACGAHKDRFTQFTILANTPGSGGLEAQGADGSWFEVPPLPGSFTINVGSLLEHWSNGVFKAVVHRVVNPAGRERFSTSFYRGCAPDTIVRPLVGAPAGQAAGEFAPMRCGDYMAGFKAAFKAPPAAAAAAAAEPAAGAAA